eukprot:gene7032-11197_t
MKTEEEYETITVPIIISTPNGNKEIGKENVNIPKSYQKYNLDVSLRSQSKILFYNAKDESFYTNRKLEKPKQIIWMIRKLESINYITRRLKETAYEMNIELEWKCSKFFDLISDPDEGVCLYYKGEKIEKKDLPCSVIPRFGSTLDKLAISVLKHLENSGSIVINNWKSLEYSSDKFSCSQIWASKKLPAPKTLLLKFPINLKFIESQFEYPLIIKKSTGSQGKGIMKINSQEELNDVSELVDESNTLLIQEFVASSSGRDIRVLIIGGKIIGAMMRCAISGYKSNFHQGGYVKQVEINDELSKLAIRAAELIGLEIYGVDFLFGKDGYKICEINASPGFEGFELSTGLNIAKLILEHSSKRGE